jgi:hypothetical protein
MNFVRKRIGLLVGLIALVVSRLTCFLSFYVGSKLKERKILYVSDSRGFLVGSVFSYKNHFGNELISGLKRDYAVLPIINRQKHTTLIDGLDFIRNTSSKFDLIIFHLGVVDFSPRGRTSAELIRARKISSVATETNYGLDKNRSELAYTVEISTREAAIYEGEPTDAIADQTYIAIVTSMIKEIQLPMIAITTNEVDLTWRGNYWRDRPPNMNSYLAIEREFWSNTGIPCVSLDDVSKGVHETTLDNIHPSKRGFQLLEQLVRKKIAKLH